MKGGTKLGVKVLCKDLSVFTSLKVLLPIQEPEWNLELSGILDNGNELLNLIRSQLTGTFVHVNLSLLADDVRKTTTQTLNLCQRKHDIAFALHVGI